MALLILVGVMAFALLGRGLYGWLALGEEAHSFKRQISQEDRHAEIVGAKPLPKAAIEIVIQKTKRDCIQIDRAEIDGEATWVYWHNQCGGTRQAFIKIQYKLQAPDGTVIARNYEFAASGSSLEAGEKGELKLRVPADPRAVKLVISTDYDHYN